MTPSPGSQKEPRRPKSSSQTTVSVSFDEDARRHRFQFEVSECVETKTVTTTTTTKRSFPPVFVREPRPLAALDLKEYPLASKPTPPELARFTFDLPGYEDMVVPSPAETRQVRDWTCKVELLYGVLLTKILSSQRGYKAKYPSQLSSRRRQCQRVLIRTRRLGYRPNYILDEPGKPACGPSPPAQ